MSWAQREAFKGVHAHRRGLWRNGARQTRDRSDPWRPSLQPDVGLTGSRRPISAAPPRRCGARIRRGSPAARRAERKVPLAPARRQTRSWFPVGPRDSAGVPAGANGPNQVPLCICPKPLSPMVGTSGSNSSRCAVSTTRARRALLDQRHLQRDAVEHDLDMTGDVDNRRRGAAIGESTRCRRSA